MASSLRPAAALLLLALLADAPSAAPSVAPPLGPLAFLVGTCWRGPFPGGHATDTHCFTPVYGGAFVRDRHRVAGAPRPYAGESLYRWDPAERKIRFEYYASDGSWGSGSVRPTEDGLSFPDQAYVEANGARSIVRSRWTRDGADAYLVVNEGQQAGVWRELWRVRMVRAGTAAEPGD